MMMDFVYGTIVGAGMGGIVAVVNGAIRVVRDDVRKKKRECLHEWNDAGTVSYDTVALYCPVCDSSLEVSKAAAKVALNAVMIRKLHDGSRKIQGAENNMTWKYEQEAELKSLYRVLSSKPITYSMYERMVALEALRETLTGVTRNREEVIKRMELEKESRKDPLQLALARNKKSQDDVIEALHRLERAVINKAWDEHMKGKR